MTVDTIGAESVYVVHCKRLHDRRAHLEAALRDLGWPSEWMEEFDPPNLSRHFPGGRSSARSLKPGEISAYLKHMEILRRVARRDVRALVLEDDAVFPPDCAARWARYAAALPPDFDLVFFGASQGMEVGALAANPLFGRADATRSMSGYLITPACAATLIGRLESQPLTAPIDLSINRIIGERGLEVYWSVPALIANGSEIGLFAHSLGVAWRERTWRGRIARAVARLRTHLRGGA